MTWIIIVIVLLVIALLFIRSKIADINESTGRNICPRCHSKMEMGPMARQYCPKCGYKEGAGYFNH